MRENIGVIEVPKNSGQERRKSSERMGEQIVVIEVPKNSRQEGVEVGANF